MTPGVQMARDYPYRRFLKESSRHRKLLDTVHFEPTNEKVGLGLICGCLAEERIRMRFRDIKETYRIAFMYLAMVGSSRYLRRTEFPDAPLGVLGDSTQFIMYDLPRSPRRRSRSRSPVRADSTVPSNRWRNLDHAPKMESNKQNEIPVMSNINSLMMNGVYQQGNMIIAATGGMFPNMMMPGPMMGPGMLPGGSMEILPGAGMEVMQQSHMDISAMGNPPMSNPPGGMDMNMMGGMMVDPSMMGMGIFPNISDTMPEKKEIILKTCKLIPPALGSAPPPRRQRPPGCRTIFVGGLPERIRDTSVREIFERYGRIHTLRLSKKNFCHIRYERESSVDTAMVLSGYRLKLIEDTDNENEEEESNANYGWLHVDFALSRDDQNEFERRQRQAMRAQQAQLQHLNTQQEMSSRSSSVSHRRSRSPSPLRVQPFSNAMIVQLVEKLKNEEQFSSTLPTLLAWLERGECSKKNSNQFYSMIQVTNSHIRRLFNEKMQSEDELQECKDKVKINIEKVIDQLEQVAKVLTAAMHQRVWDHFTKPQRKNIETWQKMAQEFNNLREEFNDKFGEDSDYSSYNKSSDSEELVLLKRENESLQFQLEAYKNEVEVIKSESQNELEKFKAQYIARQALQNASDKPPLAATSEDGEDSKQSVKSSRVEVCDARLIGIMSAFWQVHPQGASLDYVVSYVRALFPHVLQSAVHNVLQRYDDVFACTTTGVGVNIEHRWSFIAYKEATTLGT
ncbi:Ecto-NOX disulfide-thiol exchanger 2 [Eumeta japonica]|uniref:Ecto-NOX disulfide-thiol exchanger 2 n=1 Tax=Eumeta variegata TaxID=151549 RepID=A0A4C1TMT6_EUMVA|nr:Ecto-NOX disulfide-thiol exchanger 2 [Eumeta japonica]